MRICPLNVRQRAVIRVLKEEATAKPMEEAGDARQRAVISRIKEEVVARLMEEAGGGSSVPPPFQRLLGGLSEDEEHHVDLVEGEGEDEVVDTQVRCVW